MAAISGLHYAQYGAEFRSSDGRLSAARERFPGSARDFTVATLRRRFVRRWKKHETTMGSR